MSEHFASGSKLAQGARLLATLDAAKEAATRATSEHRAASTALTQQRAGLDMTQESGQKLGARSRDIRNSLLLLREAVDRAKLTALNAGLEGARQADSVGRALVTMADEVRSSAVRAIDALEEHAGLLAEVERERERCLAELAQLSDDAHAVTSAVARAEEQSQLANALLSELRTDLSELLGGGDPGAARALSAPPMIITRLTRDDFSVVSAILEVSGLHVDLEAEFVRAIALPWVLRAGAAPGVVAAFSLSWSVADELHLLDMATHPEQRRRGYSRALLAQCLSLARSEHKRLVLLEVRASNQPAIALYESAGFQTTGVRRGYYSDTGEDALEMRITLDPLTGEFLPEPA